MIKFSAEQTIYSISLLCLLFCCNALTEIHAQENENGTSNNETIPNIPSSNSNPLADAGADATYIEGKEFFVDGAASSDPDGDELSYFWKQLTPTSPTLDIKSGSINFYSKAPEVIDSTVIELELTVEDGKGGKDSDLVKITVNDNSEEPNTSLLSPPNSDAATVNHKNDTLLTSTLLPGSSLAGGKNDTLLPSTSSLLPGSSLAGGKNDTSLPSTSTTASSTTDNPDTLLPTLDELTTLEESNSGNLDLGSFNVAAAGDFGCGENAANTVKNIQSTLPEVTLALGDLAHGYTVSCWLGLVKPIEKDLHLIQGNNDIIYPTMWEEYFSKLKPENIDTSISNYYYSFTENGIHFLIMDSELPQSYPKAIKSDYSDGAMQKFLKPESDQYKFVKNDLEEASSNPEIKWIIVSLHRPMHYVPAIVDLDDVGKLVAENLRHYYQPLFDEYGVDLVLQAHKHSYQRTYPLIFNSVDMNSPLKTTSEKNYYSNPVGVIYITAGTAGYEGFDEYDFNHFPAHIASTNGPDNKKGFLELSFSEDVSKMQGTFHSNDGNIVDQFTISKKVDPSSGMFVPPS